MECPVCIAEIQPSIASVNIFIRLEIWSQYWTPFHIPNMRLYSLLVQYGVVCHGLNQLPSDHCSCQFHVSNSNRLSICVADELKIDCLKKRANGRMKEWLNEHKYFVGCLIVNVYYLLQTVTLCSAMPRPMDIRLFTVRMASANLPNGPALK